MSAVRAETGGPRRVPGVQVSGLTRTRLAWLQATHRRGWALSLWLCLAASVALPALLLLIGAMAVESSLGQVLAAQGGFSVRQDVAGVDAFNALGRQVDARVAARTGGALVPLGATVTAGPLHPVTLGGLPAPRALAGRTLTAVFAAHLGAHVAVVAGELPPEGLGGGETAVSMPRAAADQAGLHLSDRLCVDLTTATANAQPRWCARIVGLWQPLDSGDPYWAGAAPGMELTMGRYDLFQLALLHPPQGPTATVRYWASPDTVAPAGAAALAAGVSALAADLRGPQRRVDTSLDRALLVFDGRRRSVSGAIDALAVVAAAAGLGAVALVVSRFMDTQARALALLRARGWSRARTWRVAFMGPAGLGLTAVPAGLGACLLSAGALSLAGGWGSIQALHAADLAWIVPAVAAEAAAVAGLLALLAGRAAWREPRAEPRPPGRAWGPVPTALVLAAAAAGTGAMALPRLPAAAAAASAVQAGTSLLLLAPALGLVAAAAGAAAMMPFAAWVPGRSGVPGSLARLQLERRPRQHSGAALGLTLAGATAVFAALGLSTDPASGQPALRLGVDAILVAGAGGALLLALAGFGTHFRATARRRLHEYGGLFAHGLAPSDVTRGVGAEQAAIARASLVVGAILGAALALAVLPPPPALGALAALGALGALAAAALVLGSIARRVRARVDPLLLQREG